MDHETPTMLFVLLPILVVVPGQLEHHAEADAQSVTRRPKHSGTGTQFRSKPLFGPRATFHRHSKVPVPIAFCSHLSVNICSEDIEISTYITIYAHGSSCPFQFDSLPEQRDSAWVCSRCIIVIPGQQCADLDGRLGQSWS